VNEWQAARQLGMRAESAAIALKSARRIPREKLLSGMRALQECDDRLKGGSRGANVALDFLIAQLACQNAAGAAARRLDK